MSKPKITLIEIDELRELFKKDSNMRNRIMNATYVNEARKLIKTVISNEKNVTKTTVESYMEELKNLALNLNASAGINKKIEESNMEILDEEAEAKRRLEEANQKMLDDEIIEKNKIEVANKKKLDEEVEEKRKLEEANQKMLDDEIIDKNKIEVTNKKKLDEEVEEKRKLEEANQKMLDDEIIDKNKIEVANKKKLDEEVEEKRKLEEANQKMLDDEIKEKKRIEAAKKKKSDDEIENKRIEKVLKDEKLSGITEEEKKAIYMRISQIKEMDTLKSENKNLIDENDSLKNQNVLLKQRLEKLNAERAIKEDFTSKIPSLNDIASSEARTTVFINKEILLKATKYVDAHSLVRLENIIINGYDLNSAIVQSVLLEFILENSLL